MRVSRFLMCYFIARALMGCAFMPAASATPTPSPTLTASVTPTATASATPLSTATSTVTRTATPTPSPSATPTPSPTFTASATATITPTPMPVSFAGLTIPELSARAYGGGELHVEQVLSATPAFTRLLISYLSDGLRIYGFMDVPTGDGPFPVVIVLHGYVEPAYYDTLTYTTYYADILASAGYLVIHPNFRGYSPSDPGPNLFRIGYAIDVLNLIGIVKENGGKGGALASAHPDAIGLWGHSMGGGIAIRVMTVSRDVKAVVLYNSMSGDEEQNYAFMRAWAGTWEEGPEDRVPAEDLTRISPIYFLHQMTAAVSIHHGEEDLTPLAWASDLCNRLRELGRPVECFTYPGEEHFFSQESDSLFIQRCIDFFNRFLRASQ